MKPAGVRYQHNITVAVGLISKRYVSNVDLKTWQITMQHSVSEAFGFIEQGNVLATILNFLFYK